MIDALPPALIPPLQTHPHPPCPYRTMKPFIQMLVSLAVTLTLGNAYAQNSSQQPAPETQWRLTVVSKLGERPLPCQSAACKQAQQDLVQRLVKVCMYRDPATAGLFTRGDWKTAINPTDKRLCREVLFADLSDKVLYLEAAVRQSTGAFMAGQQYIHCSPEDERGEQSNLCSPARPSYCRNPELEAKWSGYNACASEFFVPYEGNPRFKSLQLSTVATTVRESNVLALLGQYEIDQAQQKAAEALQAYRTAFDNATTLTDIQAFETRYASNDPDGLIPKLAERKRSLQVQEYRQRFDVMQTENEIEEFIADYANDDPDNKLPQARRLLAEAKNRAALEAKKAAGRKAEEERVQQLDNLERQIIWCKRQTAAARSAIERENQIGRVSGYVNKLALRRAGEIIVNCEESIPRHYAEYRKLGGKRTLADLK